MSRIIRFTRLGLHTQDIPDLKVRGIADIKFQVAIERHAAQWLAEPNPKVKGHPDMPTGVITADQDGPVIGEFTVHLPE
ncbi:hypothetical protein EMG21_28350 [Klebsiella pneumoniae]|nr:hypothetical protein EMG21_28350 [Klebsiella pneumoniae]